jgi:adenine-specific DNA-methyltransferase
VSPNGTSKAVDRLVEQTLLRAEARDPASLRAAFEITLDELKVPEDLAAWTDGVDVVGRAYERLLSGEHRRSAGQFFTPFWAGELMASWLYERPVKRLLDPGVGSGSLLIQAGRHASRGNAQLIGIDSDPLAIRMAEANKKLRRIRNFRLSQGDFLLSDPPTKPDAMIVNPPYSRHHSIDPVVKAAVHNDFERRLGLRLSRLSALHVLFLVRALETSTEDARIAFITPSDWLDVNYGAKVKQFLLETAHVDAIILFEAGHLFFDNVLTTAAITFIDKGADRSQPTKIVRLGQNLPRPDDVMRMLQTRRSQYVDIVRLENGQKWSRPATQRAAGTRLGDVARIRRGIATGCNRFFVISEARRRELGLSESDLRLCATNPRAIKGQRLTKHDLKTMPDDMPRWVIDRSDPDAEAMDTPLGRYLRAGRSEFGANGGFLASRRTPWYRLEQRGDCPILFSYFNRERPRFVRNTAGAVPLNNWLIVEPKSSVDPDLLYATLTSDDVMKSLAAHARVYGGGLWKLEPSELMEIRLPGFKGAR